MDPTESAFRSDIADALRRRDVPGWTLNSLVYADWLEEHGHDDRAARRRHKVATKRRPGLRWPRARHMDGLSDHQREQLAVALSKPVGILVGTPGTGKTYCTAALVYALVFRASGPADIAICAPTGKAAVRLNSVLASRYGVNRPAARTIHQLLEVGRNGHDDLGWGFLRNARRPLGARFVVVDEASMLDTDLAAALFAACRPGTHVLLVGDPNQLPPVGHGAPLRDMIAAGVPCGRLTEIQRNAGRIVEACAAIQAGQPWEPGGNLEHYECATTPEQLGRLQVVLEMQRQKDRDPVWDVQVLAAVNTQGDLSRQALNRLMQDQLNAPVPDGSGCPWLPGDKVVCLRNHWAPGGRNAPLSCYVANGDVGRVVDVAPGRAVVQLSAPERHVIVQLPRTAAGGGEGRADADDGRVPWDLAYCLTAHKAQGSEWPVVILMIDPSPAARHVCTREWVYTALSRGKQLVITIGRLSVLKQMCARVSLDRRKTFLAEMLCNGK